MKFETEDGVVVVQGEFVGVSEIADFQEGDRVKLRADTANGWRNSRINRIAKSGRLGTVKAIVGRAIPVRERFYYVVFDAVRNGAEPVAQYIRWNELELVLAWCTDPGCGRTNPNPVLGHAMRT